jgi:nickel-type superoxide dismutase maturation protease
VGHAFQRLARRLVVEGSSMAPTYTPGERLTALRPWRRVKVGDVVVVRDPRDGGRWLLKRCVARRGRALEVRGDNPSASTDSRDFGPVDVAEVAYLVLAPRAGAAAPPRAAR